MNRRIKLPAQEWLGYDPEKGDIHGYTFEQMEELAAVIVRECIELNRQELSFNAFERMLNKYQEHFGVSQ